MSETPMTQDAVRKIITEEVGKLHSGPSGKREDLVIAQYTSLRNEIRGHMVDEVSVLTSAMAVMGAVVTIAAWQSVVGLLAVVPLFVWVTWRKFIAGTANTFRIAAFLKVYYEGPADKDNLSWERAVEIYRLHRDKPAQERSWRIANINAMRTLIVVAVIASVFVAAKSEIEVRDTDAKALAEYNTVVRSLNVPAVMAPSSTVTPTLNAPRSPQVLLADAKAVRDAVIVAERWRRLVNVGGLVLVFVLSVVAFQKTRDVSQNVGNEDWRQAVTDLMEDIHSGKKTRENAPRKKD